MPRTKQTARRDGFVRSQPGCREREERERAESEHAERERALKASTYVF